MRGEASGPEAYHGHPMTSPDPLTPERERELKQALLDTQCKDAWFAKLTEAEQAKYLADHVRGRFDVVRRWVVPWIRNLADLEASRVVEIGCGTGSTTAAFALETGTLDCYDIATTAVEMARRRIDVFGLKNVTFHCHPAATLVHRIEATHPPGSVDVVLCFAMLEHATHGERQDTLRAAWNLLKPGGLLVVGDTPNRLSPFDGHTTWLPFFESLPHDVALDYFSRTPRQGLAALVTSARRRSTEAALEQLTRLGRGVSYHDFELAIGADVHGMVVGDGFDPEPLAYYGIGDETRFLYGYAVRRNLAIHPAFLRSTIDVVLQKPGGTPLRPRPRDVDTIVSPYGGARWNVVASEGHEATLFISADHTAVMRVAFGANPGPESWRVRLVARPVALTADAHFIVSFRARADRPRRLVYSVKQHHDPWANVGLAGSVRLTSAWQDVQARFQPRFDCPEAVFAFELGGSNVPVEIASPTLRPT